MEWADVLLRIQAGEGLHTEFKRGASNLAAIGRTICAFGNSDGGLIVLGVDNAARVMGVGEESEAVQERLAGFLQTGCSVPVSGACGRQLTLDGWVHWIEVRRLRRRFEPLHFRGRFWIRRGRSSVEPSPSERQELFDRFGFVLTEEQVIGSASRDDIDIVEFRAFQRLMGLDVEEQPQPEADDDLRNSQVLVDDDRMLRPTLYGILAFGKQPQAHPQTASFYIQCVAYAGTDRASAAISVGDSRGRLDEQVRHALGWFRSLGWQEQYHGVMREDIPLVPESVLREALVNAVIHREYAVVGASVMLEVFSDRVDVTSPGNLPNRMTVASVKSGGVPRSRNESMANSMVVRRLMERRGRGWLTMRRTMREFNRTEPGLVDDEGGGFVRVTFRLAAKPAGSNP